jgi:hypothetical protein
MSIQAIVENALEQGQGILRLAPNWVPRSFCVPGRRIKLHPPITTHLAASAAASTSAGLPPRRPPTTVLKPARMKV